MLNKSRKIVERILIEGTLELITPASLGNGDSDGLTDMPLLIDSVSGNALLTGSTVAGALRNYLRECLLGYGQSEESQYLDKQGKRRKQKDSGGNLVNVALPVITKLFGFVEDKDGAQSCLIIDDARSVDDTGNPKIPTTELRDGVKIANQTLIAENGKKFDLELLEAGTKFTLRFELLITEKDDKDELLTALATALHGFETGEIHIGARKRRGYGECKVSGWKYVSYDLKTKDGLMRWLKHEQPNQPLISIKDISGGLTVSDERDWFEIDADFALDGSILIRSGSKFSDEYQPDHVHLRSGGKPIISGTSLAGALRHRALRIAKTVGDETKAKTFVDEMFGVDMDELKKANKQNGTKKKPFASRLEVKERTMEIDRTLVHTRVKIDRFTGGAMDTALFDAAPIFSDGNEKAVNLFFKLRFKHNQKPDEKNAEIGLLLLLLKDLWTSDLAIGGESSIGRGRLIGCKAELKFKNDAVILEADGREKIKPLDADKTKALEDCVKEFNKQLTKSDSKEEQKNGE